MHKFMSNLDCADIADIAKDAIGIENRDEVNCANEAVGATRGTRTALKLKPK